MLPTMSTEGETIEHYTPTLCDVETALRRLNNNKSAGPDGIKAELFKINEMKLNRAIHSLICCIWTQEQMPTEWDEGSVCPIYKKGDKLECGNYRGITLLNIAYKIFSNILFKRLETYTSKIIGSYQCGFQKGKTTTDQLHTIRQILEKTKEYNIDTYHLFIDFKAAYDSINREKLLEAMLEFNIPKKLISLTRMTLKRVSCRIKISSSLSEPFFTEKGLRQGDSLSCLLFNIALEKTIRDSGINTNGTILHRTVQLLAFADDIDIIGRTKHSVIDAFVALESTAKEMGLVINADKTKFLIATNKTPDPSPLKIMTYSFETVSQFKYLGTLISSRNDLKIEINNRIFMANRSFYGLRNQLKSKFLSVKTKLSIYKTLIRPIVMYGSECWTLNKTEEEKLLIFERKILRKIFGPIQENNVRRILYNHEIYKKYDKFDGTDIVRTIKASRIRWLGHLFRNPDATPAKKVTFSRIEGKRRKGRPPTRWLDDVEKDLKLLGVNRWRAVAPDRARWRRICESALACKRLLCL
jgi:sorting nexin-29